MCYVYVGGIWSGKTGKMFLLWSSNGKQITLCSEVIDKTGEAENQAQQIGTIFLSSFSLSALESQEEVGKKIVPPVQQEVKQVVIKTRTT